MAAFLFFPASLPGAPLQATSILTVLHADKTDIAQRKR